MLEMRIRPIQATRLVKTIVPPIIFQQGLLLMAAHNKMQIHSESLHLKRSLFRLYCHAIFLAAISFGLAHGCQSLVVDLLRSESFNVVPSAFVTLTFFIVMHSAVFTVAALLLVHPILWILRTALKKLSLHKHHLGCVVIGALIGLFFLPISAYVAFSMLHEIDSPSYLSRCAEFALPMVIAGLVAGHSFWRLIRMYPSAF